MEICITDLPAIAIYFSGVLGKSGVSKHVAQERRELSTSQVGLHSPT